MPRLTHTEAYPGIEFRPRTINWLSRLIRMPGECAHLEGEPTWMATFLPDTLYLRGKTTALRVPSRPEASLCRECLTQVLEKELAAYSGRAVVFEPDGATVSQYFFVAAPDFDAAGLEPALIETITGRLSRMGPSCQECSRPATWLWFSREAVPHLDANEQMASAVGEYFCAQHGAEHLCRSLCSIQKVNLLYVNAPYGESGAYVWI